MKGYRNTLICLAYIAACVGVAAMARPEDIPSLGPSFLALGGGVVGVVFGRAANKKVENGKPA